MAGLSSITAITRPLGEVNLAAMNRCVGVYKMYLNGGGGGGGGFDDYYEWYGGAGSHAEESEHSRSLVPPIALTAGAGGDSGEGPVGEGEDGWQTWIADSRGVYISSALGGYGGVSAYTRRLYQQDTAMTMLATVYDRFTLSFFYYGPPSTPYFEVTTGRGGGSMENGWQGGIIKAFRIG